MKYPITTLDQLRPILLGFRKSRGLTQAALAAKLGVAQQTYAQLESSPGSISVERLFKLLRVLGVELVLADTASRPETSAPHKPERRPATKAQTGQSRVAATSAQARSLKKAPSSQADPVPSAKGTRSATDSQRLGKSLSVPKKREVW